MKRTILTSRVDGTGLTPDAVEQWIGKKVPFNGGPQTCTIRGAYFDEGDLMLTIDAPLGEVMSMEPGSVSIVPRY